MSSSTNSQTLAINAEVEEFLAELRTVRQLSVHTLKAYQLDLDKLLTFASEHDLSVHKIQNSHIRQWVARLHGQGMSARSLARILSAWRGFYEWLLQRQDKSSTNLLTSPMVDIRAPKRGKNLPKALSVEHVQVLIEYAQREATAENQQSKFDFLSQRFAQRDLALYELFYSSGLRLSEILGIDLQPLIDSSRSSLGWIDWDAAEVNVLGKGGKRRVVPIGSHAMQALEQWKRVLTDWFIHRLEKNKSLQGAPLFVNEELERLSPRTVQARLKKLALKSGLPTHVHPHMLRHSFASHVLQSSHDLRAVQEMLGHASIGSTQIYTALDFQHLAQAYDLAHPRAKSNKSN